MARGPMAKHPDARQRRNAPVSTAREIVLRNPEDGLLPAPPLPERTTVVDGVEMELDYHVQAKVAWVELWQYPLVYQAPEVDKHLLYVYVNLLDQFHRRVAQGKAVTELAKEIRAFSELWGVGEKSRRHLQITIQEAEEAIERGRKAQIKRVEPVAPSAEAFTPSWSDDDEDHGDFVDAEVVE
ncbi:MAG: phage terminase small subunit [Mycobacteriaceae bacterium]